MNHGIKIRFDARTRQWRVQNLRRKVLPGDTVTWTLVTNRRDVAARFQFPFGDVFRRGVTRDWTARIVPTLDKKGLSGNTLTLTVARHAYNGANPRYYAVWIVDSRFRAGGVYAIGDNPPPEFEVGP